MRRILLANLSVRRVVLEGLSPIFYLVSTFLPPSLSLTRKSINEVLPGWRDGREKTQVEKRAYL